MLETFIQWFLIGTIIKLIYEVFYAKTGRRRRNIKYLASDLFTIVVIIVVLALMVS